MFYIFYAFFRTTFFFVAAAAGAASSVTAGAGAGAGAGSGAGAGAMGSYPWAGLGRPGSCDRAHKWTCLTGATSRDMLSSAGAPMSSAGASVGMGASVSASIGGLGLDGSRFYDDSDNEGEGGAGARADARMGAGMGDGEEVGEGVDASQLAGSCQRDERTKRSSEKETRQIGQIET